MHQTTSHYIRCLPVLMFAALACGGNISGGDGGFLDDGLPIATTDARPTYDAYIDPNCVPGTTECTDCIDNDNDGVADGNDPECTSAADNDEGSFATDIPGDNIDPNWQDCFFDGDSGAGNDGCRYHTCCLIGNCNPGMEADSCTSLTQECIDFCQPATTPGCDCFGCCTICKDGTCYDVATNPAISPDCTYEVIDDPTKCLPCTQSDLCGNPCDPDQTDCLLCPGELPESLPPGCNGSQECPNGAQQCVTNADCPQPDGGLPYYCQQGCCLAQVG